jgi:hypothetical protein
MFTVFGCRAEQNVASGAGGAVPLYSQFGPSINMEALSSSSEVGCRHASSSFAVWYP